MKNKNRTALLKLMSEEQIELVRRSSRCYHCCWGRWCGGLKYTCLRAYCIKAHGEQHA